MSVSHQRVLWLWGGLLAALLSLLFLPLTPGGLRVAILLVALFMIAGLVRSGRKPECVEDDGVSLDELPTAPYRLPVVLVCGNTDNWPAERDVHRTPQGCWLRVPEAALQQTVRQLRGQRPELVSQLAVMACVHPQQYDDLNVLTGYLLTLRWQMVQLRRDTGLNIPLILAGAVAGASVTTPSWQSVMPGEDLQRWQDDNDTPQNARSWTMEKATSDRLHTQILFSAQARFVREVIVPVLADDNPDMDAVPPSMVLYHQVKHLSGYRSSSLWQQFLVRHTTLNSVAGWEGGDDAASAEHRLLPDFILPLLPHGGGCTPRNRMLRRAFGFFTVALLAALVCSAWNNRQLLHRVSFDISQYNRIAMMDSLPKAQAVATLRTDAAWLNNGERNGEPLRYGLGLYRGERLRPAVLAAIQSYVQPVSPPQPVIKTVVNGLQTVRLDSMSLFDSGKWQLKPGSAKVLINALVGIKAKPGWLIVVTGHTDNTGDDSANQALSLKRAASVRDWMRDTGDLPESCFAVQGDGESRPVATNDTPEGRAQNRRVEISLVPQADACRVPATHNVAKNSDIPKHD
ncbi:OmpA family protein [Citrobacter werkmanii]|uniref:OmpA family protein n=1 Tax=Citrobacter werkmanii TaxID=67827 RepID=UPI002654C273|nr:OmpA family protein [Citrobacter werkmanii]MDN8559102.1 OmpA family protein [Citrobacter werkmanii]